MKSPTKNYVLFYRKAALILDLFGLLAITTFLIHLLPPDVLNSEPATGGDLGSHFWPLVTLVKHSLPNWSVRTWNPGNLGGEPHLVHYFPLPYFFMAGISCFTALGTAFNLGSLLHLFALPLCAYCMARLLGSRFPGPILAAAACSVFIYNESFSMWGGNGLSTMAGQFSHGYALCFLLLGTGFLAKAMRLGKIPVGAAICFALVTISHSYVMLGLPFVVLPFIFFPARRAYLDNFKLVFLCGILTLLLSLWFLVPQIQNAPWTIAYFFNWQSSNIWSEVCPKIFYPVLVTLLTSLAALLSYTNQRYRTFYLCSVFLIPTLAYLIYYFIFPTLGLVDVRAVPQIQLYLCLLSGLLLGSLLRRFGPAWAYFLALPLTLLSLHWSWLHIENLPNWARWNYSGWQNKPLYPDLMALSNKIHGDFSQARVIYEQNILNSAAGTERVFEMLPYFSGRATLESVYMQASLLAPAAFLLQAEISKTPSCPYQQFPCKEYNLVAAQDRLRLLGVGGLILRTEELLKQAGQVDYLSPQGVFGPWHYFELKPQPKLVEVVNQMPEVWYKLPEDWKDKFYQWLKSYKTGQNFIAVDLKEPGRLTENLDQVKFDSQECHPTLEVDFSKLVLHTDCPGHLHLLKFAYHSAWSADSSDKILILSPGFLALVPSKETVVLRFGVVSSWYFAGTVSIITLLLVILLAFLQRGSRRIFCLTRRDEGRVGLGTSRLSFLRVKQIFYSLLALTLTLWSLTLYIISPIRAYNRFELLNFDFGILFNSTYLLSKFKAPYLTTRGLLTWADNQDYFQIFLSPLHYFPGAHYSLLLVHALAIWSVGLLAAYVLRAKALTAISLAAFVWFSPFMFNMATDYFHTEAFTTLFLLGMFLALLSQRKRVFLSCAVLALLCKEDVALTVFALLFVMRVFKFCPKEMQRSLYCILGLSFGLFVFNQVLVMPLAKELSCAWISPDKIVGYDLRPSSPWFGAINLSSLSFWKEKFFSSASFDYILLLCWPLLFIPKYAWRFGIALIPSLALNLLAGSYLIQAQYHYDHSSFAVVLCALIYALKYSETPKKLINLWTALFLLVICFQSYHVKYRTAPSDIFQASFWNLKKDQKVAELEQQAHKLQPNQIISADYQSINYLLSSSAQVYMFPNPILPSYFGIYGICEKQLSAVPQADQVILQAKYRLSVLENQTLEQSYKLVQENAGLRNYQKKIAP